MDVLISSFCRVVRRSDTAKDLVASFTDLNEKVNLTTSSIPWRKSYDSLGIPR